MFQEITTAQWLKPYPSLTACQTIIFISLNGDLGSSAGRKHFFCLFLWTGKQVTAYFLFIGTIWFCCLPHVWKKEAEYAKQSDRLSQVITTHQITPNFRYSTVVSYHESLWLHPLFKNTTLPLHLDMHAYINTHWSAGLASGTPTVLSHCFLSAVFWTALVHVVFSVTHPVACRSADHSKYRHSLFFVWHCAGKIIPQYTNQNIQ